MSTFVVLGAGVMGSALCIPASDNDHQVTLVGSPLDDNIVASINATRHHPNLKIDLHQSIKVLKDSECTAQLLCNADVIVIGVSSPGIEWACNKITQANAKPKLVSLVTKGLVANSDLEQPPLTYAHTLPERLNLSADQLVGIGGPCIARELALKIPTHVVFGSQSKESCHRLSQLLQTRYYRIKTTSGIVQLEACAALKNFLCIGISAMLGTYPLGDSQAKNPVAALFNQAVIELGLLSHWLQSTQRVSPLSAPLEDNNAAFDLAGMGDLHVTVGGGRNSKLGQLLGQGYRLDHVLQNQLLNITVEGVDTGRRLYPGVEAACKKGIISPDAIPLTLAILHCIHNESEFTFSFDQLP